MSRFFNINELRLLFILSENCEATVFNRDSMIRAAATEPVVASKDDAGFSSATYFLLAREIMDPDLLDG